MIPPRIRNLQDFLLPYQRKFVNDQSRYKVWLAARQVGKSTAVAFEALRLAAGRPETAILLVSASQRQSGELLERVRRWTGALKLGVHPEIMARESAVEIRLANGSRILSLPANPDTIRGFSGHIFLDEFAFHRDSKSIWAAVFPIATRGFLLRIASTPNGRRNMFHDIWHDDRGLWSRHQTSVHQAVEQGLTLDLERLRAGTPDPETWAQEYECRFVDESTAFLTLAQIEAVRSPQAGWGDFGNGPAYIGVDIGRRRDLTVFWALELVGDIFWTREVSELSGASFAEQDRILDRLVSRCRPRRICMDQTGLGEKPVEDAQRRYGRSRVEGVRFTQAAKQELALTLRRHLENRQVRIPDRPEIIEDLHQVRRSVTASGTIRFEASRSSDGHADRFWALALALAAAGSPTPSLPQITSAGGRSMPGRLEAY